MVHAPDSQSNWVANAIVDYSDYSASVERKKEKFIFDSNNTKHNKKAVVLT